MNNNNGFFDWLGRNGTIIGGFMTIALAISLVVTLVQQIIG